MRRSVRCVCEFQRSAAFEWCPIRNGYVVDVAKARKRSRKAQSEVQGFQRRIIAASKDLVVCLHDRTAPKVVETVFAFPFANIDEDVFENCCESLGADACFCVVLCQVFVNGPKVQKRSPIDVAKVYNEQVCFERIDEGIIARQVDVPQTWSVLIVRDNCELVSIWSHQGLGEIVTAIHVFLAFARGIVSRARMTTHDWKAAGVSRMVLSVFEKGKE